MMLNSRVPRRFELNGDPNPGLHVLKRDLKTRRKEPERPEAQRVHETLLRWLLEACLTLDVNLWARR